MNGERPVPYEFSEAELANQFWRRVAVAVAIACVVLGLAFLAVAVLVVVGISSWANNK